MGDSLLIILLLLFMFGRKKGSSPSSSTSPTMHNKEVITWVDRKGRTRTIVTEREVHYE